MSDKMRIDASFYDLYKELRPEAFTMGDPGASKTDIELPHGTTIIAFLYKDGAIMAADGRMSAGHAIWAEDTEKVYRLDDSTVIGSAGLAMLCARLPKMLKANFNYNRRLTDDDYSFNTKANFVARMVRENFWNALRVDGFLALPILAGYDPVAKGARIVYYDSVGGLYERTADGYVSVGSGSYRASNCLELLWTPGLNRTDAIKLARKAIAFAGKKDSGTGVITMIYSITRDGVAKHDTGGER